MKIEKRFLGYKKIVIFLPEWEPGINIEVLKKDYISVSLVTYSRQDIRKMDGFTEKSRTTALIDLKKQKFEDIFSAFNYETRSKIRKALNNIELKFISVDPNFEKNYGLYKIFESKQGRLPSPKQELSDCLFFSCYKNEEIISQVICQNIDSVVLRVRNICSKRLDVIDKKLYQEISIASKMVMQEAMKYAFEKKYKYFDINGVNLVDKNKQGITKFKQGFGGDLVDEFWYNHRKGWYLKLGKLLKIKAKIINSIKKF